MEAVNLNVSLMVRRPTVEVEQAEDVVKGPICDLSEGGFHSRLVRVKGLSYWFE